MLILVLCFLELLIGLSNIKNKLIRKILEIITGIDKRVQLPKNIIQKHFQIFFKKIKIKSVMKYPQNNGKLLFIRLAL